jgi:hypothetical protein
MIMAPDMATSEMVCLLTGKDRTFEANCSVCSVYKDTKQDMEKHGEHYLD